MNRKGGAHYILLMAEQNQNSCPSTTAAVASGGARVKKEVQRYTTLLSFECMNEQSYCFYLGMRDIYNTLHHH